MDAAKIRLSAEERELVFQPEWILTKNRVLEKVREMFVQVQDEYRQQLQQLSAVPAEVLQYNFKISKGENYLGLPWLVLDYPRCFGREDVFAVRTMFWWGNFFSITLQLSGKYKVQYEDGIIHSYGKICNEGYFICTEDDPWQHHFDENNYQQAAGFSSGGFKTLIKEKGFLKLAAKFPLQQWDDAIIIFSKKFRELMKMLNA